MTQLFFAKRKPRQCPVCKSKKIASIQYGYPSCEAFEKAEQKKIVLGGCCISDHDPSWQCVDCGTDIYAEILRTPLTGISLEEERIRKARQLLSDEQLTAFFRAIRGDTKVLAVKFINEKLDNSVSLDKIFYTGEIFGYTLSVRKLAGEARFKISFGYAAFDAGDGGEWKVKFNGNQVVLAKLGIIRII
jgi:hypothetical protein